MDFYRDIERFGDSIVALTEDDREFTYRELLDSADKLVEDIASRTLVFLCCRNNISTLRAYLGCLRKEIVPVLIQATVDQALLDNLLDLYHPAYLLKQGEKFEKTNLAKDYSINDELALLLTTSGSTGSPKLVRQSYKNIERNATSIAQYLDITAADRPITTMPMSYTYGLSIINSHLLMGASIVLTEKTMMEKEFWTLLREKQATTFGGVPYIYEMLKKLRFFCMDLPSLKVLTQAGGKLSPELSLEFATHCHDKGMQFVVMYGQTEATARMSYLPPEYAISKAGSMGIAIPGGRFDLIDANGRSIEQADVIGELVYTGDNVTLGYAENRFDLCKGDENKGVLVTGDMAKRDIDGFYTIVGRKKRFLKLFGNRVNLDEVEQLLKKEGFDCACGGHDDMLKIYTVEAQSVEALKSFVNSRTGINSNGYNVEIVDKIPRSEAGKVLYNELGAK